MMPSIYDSAFWRQRAHETCGLAEQMKDSGSKAAMTKLARRYEQIALRSAFDETRIAFESAREGLRVSEGVASIAQVSSLKITVDAARHEMQNARRAMEVFRATHLLMADDAEVLDGADAAASLR
jgi:hypothetical protein